MGGSIARIEAATAEVVIWKANEYPQGQEEGQDGQPQERRRTTLNRDVRSSLEKHKSSALASAVSVAPAFLG